MIVNNTPDLDMDIEYYYLGKFKLPAASNSCTLDVSVQLKRVPIKINISCVSWAENNIAVIKA
jgi:hypothetical protein